MDMSEILFVCLVTRSDIFPTNHGAAVKIVRTAEEFARQNAACFIVTSDRDSYWQVDREGNWSTKHYGRRLRAMEEWILFRYGASWAEKLCKKMGYPQEEWFLYTAQFDLAWLLRVVFVGIAENISVFQAEFPGFGLVSMWASRVVSWLDGRRTHVQSSIVQHNVECIRLQDFGHDIRYMKAMERYALSVVDHVIAVSADDKKRMVDLGIEAKKISVIPHGVDCTQIEMASSRRAQWRNHWNIDDRELVLFFHGTLHYAPNTEAVRFIAEQLIAQLDMVLPDVLYRFVIVGMNPPRYYSHDKILFTDSVEDLAGHMHMADICVCPLFAGGGTRLKLVEYLATGKPIVTTHKGAEGIADVGQFWYAETAEEFAQQIKMLYHQAITASNAFDNISRKIERGFALARALSWENMGRYYMNLYHQPRLQGRDFFAEVVQGVDNTSQTTTVSVTSHLPSQYTPSKERTMLLLINRGCNLRCSFCDLWDNHEQMEYHAILPILDDAVAIGTKVLVITGGEPLLHKNIVDVIRSARMRGLSVNVTTNGLLVEKYWRDLLLAGVSSLSFSLDGITEVHDTLRGQVGAFEKTCKAIRLIKKNTDIPCSVYFVATKTNVHQLWDVYQLTKEMGVDFDFWPVNDAPELYIREPNERELWIDTVQRIMQDNPKYRSREQFYVDSLRYHMEDTSVQMSRCLGFVEQYGVTYTGDFLPCCVWNGTGLVQGNVFATSLKELWNSPKIQEYRRNMVEHGCAVGCFNHSLYEYQVATARL